MAQVSLARVRMLLVAALAIVVGDALMAQRPAEYQVKAAYLYGFGRFVEWPAEAATAADGAFVLCVLGDDPFGRLLDQATEGGQLKNRPVSVRRIGRAEDAAECDTLFISASEDGRLARILSVLGRRPVLTVGDSPEFDLRGAFRFHEEFAVAVELLNKGLVDVKPLISASVPYRDAGRAFALAADRSQAMKVLLDFD